MEREAIESGRSSADTGGYAPGHSGVTLIITMDDATNEHYSMFFVQEEGTVSGFQGVRDEILQRGLFSFLTPINGISALTKLTSGRK